MRLLDKDCLLILGVFICAKLVVFYLDITMERVILRSEDEIVIANPCMHIRIYFSKARNEYYFKARYERETLNCIPQSNKLTIFCQCCRQTIVFDINTNALDWNLMEFYNYEDSSSESSEGSCIGCELNHQDGYFGGRCEECKCHLCDDKKCLGGIDGARCMYSDTEEEEDEVEKISEGVKEMGME